MMNQQQHPWDRKRFDFVYATLSIVFLFMCFAVDLKAQDVEQAVKRVGKIGEERLNITGGIQLNNQLYSSTGIDARRDNWQWGIRANLNLSFLGMSAPFSVAFSDANTNYRLPSYTFVGLSPTYKWATLHLGDRSLAFSRYTMSGISFRGVGFTLEPGRWYASGFYGRLNRALSSDLDAVGDLLLAGAPFTKHSRNRRESTSVIAGIVSN